MKKIAFLFLTKGDHNYIKAWDIFFSNIPMDEYNIYCHPKIVPSQKILKKNIIGTVIPTSWAHISLVRATILLFLESFNDPQNYFFILLSESCIPMINFQKLKEILIQKNTSFIHYKHLYNKLDRYKKLHPKIKSQLPFNHFYCQYQWMILKRDIVKFFLENDYTELFKYIPVPDEHYFITLLTIFKKLKEITNIKTTYCDWSNKNSMHPRVIRNLINIPNNNCFFLRKIDRNFKANPIYFQKIKTVR